jgi:hypothetical protein
MPKGKRLFCVQPQRRKRVTQLTPDEKRRIIFLFDASGGDYDQAADRCGIPGLQRADVLAIVLADMRRGPERAPAMRAPTAERPAVA